MNVKDKILYLREESESSIREESKFFLHVYPTDKSLLGKNKTGNLNYNFKNNTQKFSHEISFHDIDSKLDWLIAEQILKNKIL